MDEQLTQEEREAIADAVGITDNLRRIARDEMTDFDLLWFFWQLTTDRNSN